jgi:multicomponent Na+:H+ antiporter subunit F
MIPSALPVLAVDTVAPFLEGALALALVLSVWRLFRGPSLPDRVIALEVSMATTLGFLLLAAVRRDESAFIDIALLVALVSFVTTLAFARFLDRAHPHD